VEAIWKFARARLREGKGPALLIGVVGGDGEEQLRRLREDFAFLQRGAHPEQPATKVSPAADYLENELAIRGRRAGAFLEIDCAPRSWAAVSGATPEFPLFEDELAALRGRWRSRASFLLSPRHLGAQALWLLVLLAPVIGFVAWRDPNFSTDPRGTLAEYFAGGVTGSHPSDWWGIFAFAIFCLFWPIRYAEAKFLPERLRATENGGGVNRVYRKLCSWHRKPFRPFGPRTATIDRSQNAGSSAFCSADGRGRRLSRF